MISGAEILRTKFDHIYVITLKRAVERHERIKEVLAGIPFHFFYGADKKEFNIQELKQKGIYSEEKAKALHRYSKPMNGGQIGCSWSHRMVYEDIIQKGYKNALILEDDVIPTTEGMTALPPILNELPDDWELLYMDHAKNTARPFLGSAKQFTYHLQHLLGKLKWSHRTISNLYARPYTDHLRLAGYHDFTSAYAITLQGAKKLVELQTPLCFVADHLLAHAATNGILRSFICLPRPFAQESQAANNIISYVEE